MRAELVRARAAGDEEGVEVVRLYISERPVDGGLDLALVALELGARLQADDRDLISCLPEGVVRIFELGVLELGAEHTGDLHGKTS